MRKYAVSVNKCAKILSRDRITIYNAISQGRLKAYKVNNKWQIPLFEVSRFIGKTQIRRDDSKNKIK
jgi:hypothetical protein